MISGNVICFITCYYYDQEKKKYTFPSKKILQFLISTKTRDTMK